jgi:kynurenine 3-monooxygenase
MSEIMKNENIILVGAGLVGSLLSIFLAKRGCSVEILERRPDMRKEEIAAGRSINLALSARGLHALAQVGLKEEILKQAIPMRGRMIHSRTGELTFQPYGRNDEECIYSISRSELNKSLMTFAESTEKVAIQFNQKVTSIDFQSNTIHVVNELNNASNDIKFSRVIGTDGSASAIRNDMMKNVNDDCTISYLEYGYKELLIPEGANGIFQMEKNGLHIWPRGTYMLIALPNFDGSFTATLFLPFEGEDSFATLNSPVAVLDFFAKQFPDVAPMMHDLETSFFANPVGRMNTVTCSPWNVEDKALLLGDASHAIVPFFGQGMNCGFEDCTVLDQLIAETNNWGDVFDTFGGHRKTNTDAIAAMAIENFIEMRDKVADPQFLLEKGVEKILQEKFPDDYISRYALVTFNRVPYRIAFDIGRIQNAILAELCQHLSQPNQVDLNQAESLISQKLKPFLRENLANLSN